MPPSSFFLRGSIGNNLQNAADDVLNVKDTLSRLGLFDMTAPPEPHGYITQGLVSAIKGFQENNGLTVDGKMFPGGETEKKIGAAQGSPAPEQYGPPVPEKYGPEQPGHTIDTFFPRIEKAEGGYTAGNKLNAKDVPTNFGIRARTLSEYAGYKKLRGETLPSNYTTDITAVTPELAPQIYDEMYYKRYNIDKISDTYTAGHLLDIAINPGPARAAAWVQEELNKLGANLTIDNTIGPATRQAIAKVQQEGLLTELNNAIAEKRFEFYKQQSSLPDKSGFKPGWLDRAQSYIRNIPAKK